MAEYFISDSRGQHGPYRAADLPSQGVTARTFVWCEGMSDWARAGFVHELADFINAGYAYAQQPANDLASIAQNRAAHGGPYAGRRYGPDYSHGGYYRHGESQQGMAIAGFVLSLKFPLLGLIFSAIALGNISKSSNKEGHGLALAGLIVSIVSMALGCLWMIVIFGVFARF